jgi:hypothetical protein
MDYLLRDVDEKTWEQFKRACGELSIRGVLLAVVQSVADGDIVIRPQQIRRGKYPRRSE